MLRAILEARVMVALVVAAGVGMWGTARVSVRPDEVFLAVIDVRGPLVFQALVYGRRVSAMRSRPLPPYPGPEKRSTPMLVLGGSHHHTTPGRALQPT